MRVSTRTQDPDLQRRALLRAGVSENNIYADVVTGASAAAKRPGWRALMETVPPHSTIYVWRLDRLGRDLSDVVATVEKLQSRKIVVRSIVDGIDPTTPQGKLMLGLAATLASYERELIRERVVAGMEAAKARGVRFGRKPLDVAAERDKAQIVLNLLREGDRTVADAGRLMGWSRATTYRRLALLGDEAGYPTSSGVPDGTGLRRRRPGGGPPRRDG